MIVTPPDITQHFAIEGRIGEVIPIETGHINHSFRVQVLHQSQARLYFLQAINGHVFPDPHAVMNNIYRVTQHLRLRLGANPEASDLDRKVLRLIPTREGRLFFSDHQASWRVFPFILDSVSYDVAPNLKIAARAAFAFGQFSSLLHDLPGLPLTVTIPNFHNAKARIEAFDSAFREDALGRACSVQAERAFLEHHRNRLVRITALLEQGTLPSRVTHNDTKLNNVLFDRDTAEPLCVVDLDTVMQGSCLFDFGDLVRSCISNAPEDTTDLMGIRLEEGMFQALVRGYCAGAGAILCEEEWCLLGGAGIWMCLLLGMRFLTDYLSGDRYFKVKYPGHNLDRSRAQFQIAKLMLERESVLNELVMAVRDEVCGL